MSLSGLDDDGRGAAAAGKAWMAGTRLHKAGHGDKSLSSGFMLAPVKKSRARQEPRRPSRGQSSMHALADSPSAAYVGPPR